MDGDHRGAVDGIQMPSATDTGTAQEIKLHAIKFAAVFNILVLLAVAGAFRWRNFLTYWHNDVSKLVQRYLQKSALYNLGAILILWFLNNHLFPVPPRSADSGYPDTVEERSDNLECIRLGDHKLLAWGIIVACCFVGLLRYVATGFAFSDSRAFNASEYSMQGLYEGVKLVGFDASSNATFKQVIGFYLKLLMLITIASGALLYGPLDKSLTDTAFQTPFCTIGWPHPDPEQSFWSLLTVKKIATTGLLLLVPIVVTIFIQHVDFILTKGVYTQIPGYFAVLNSPFVTVNLSTTWFAYVGIAVSMLICDCIGGGANLHVVLVFFWALDSALLLCLCLIAGRKNRA